MTFQCRAAVLRAYREIKRSSRREDHAYDVAVQVFRHNHPQRRRVDAYQIVADWLDHDEAGADPLSR